MYQSRLHLTNGIVSIAVDAPTGEVLDFVRESTGDNVFKNHVQRTWRLLDGMLLTDQGNLRFRPPRHQDLLSDPALAPEVSVRQGEKEGCIRIHFPYLVAADRRVDISADVSIAMRPLDCRTYWNLTLDNRTGFEMDNIAFPALDGIWLGEQWEDDVLVYPQFAGCRIDNPTRTLASDPQLIHWRWQEWIYEYNIGQQNGTRDERGAYAYTMNYSGRASMLFMDLYDEKEGTGIDLTCRNTTLSMKALRMESFGESDPGVGLAILHRPGSKAPVYTTDECVLAFHEGDWHWAADDYRTWFSTLPFKSNHRLRPEWFEKSPGLMAHYDFQYQTGGVVHTYRDIPDLMRSAMDMGFSHLLLAGWHDGGHDRGFPHYRVNPDLGTEQELKDAVRQCRDMGGHVCFYINSRLCNTGLDDVQEWLDKSTIMNRDGSLFIEKYGCDELSFASMCNNEPSWRQYLENTVRYLTKEIGADGMYLDQLAMADSCKCYHPGHEEHQGNACQWNQGYRKLLSAIEADTDQEGMALIYEGCNDAFGRCGAGQLMSELHCPFKGRMPQVYAYTFPDQMLVDMMNPRRHSAMRPEHVARHSTELLHNAFTIGAYLWCYDLAFDNNWQNDQEQCIRLQKLVALRSAWLQHYGRGRFTDTVGILCAPQDEQIRRFALDAGQLLACASETGLHGEVTVSWTGNRIPDVHVLTMEHPEPVPMPFTLQSSGAEVTVTVSLPQTECAVIVLEIPGQEKNISG